MAPAPSRDQRLDQLNEFLLGTLTGKRRDLYAALWQDYCARGPGLDAATVLAAIGVHAYNPDRVRAEISKLRKHLGEVQGDPAFSFANQVTIPDKAPYRLELLLASQSSPSSPALSLPRRARRPSRWIALAAVPVVAAIAYFGLTLRAPLLEVNVRIHQKLNRGGRGGWRPPATNRAHGLIRLAPETELQLLARSNRLGYVYVAAEERYTDGTASPPMLLLGNSDNRLEPNSYLDFPKNSFLTYEGEPRLKGKVLAADYWYLLLTPFKIGAFSDDRVQTILTEKEFAIFGEAYQGTLQHARLAGNEQRTIMDGHFNARLPSTRPVAFQMRLNVDRETKPGTRGSAGSPR